MEAERIKNSRARSAKLRIARRTNTPRLTALHDPEVGQIATGQPSFDHGASSSMEAHLCV